MAARDRYGGFSEPATTPLQRYIRKTFALSAFEIGLSRLDECLFDSPENACDPQNFEPNLALNLEIADLINQKKGNAYGPHADATCNFRAALTITKDLEKQLLPPLIT